MSFFKLSSFKKKKSYFFGIISEMIAVFYLRLKFYQILKRRYKNKAGEIDIIARKNNSLIAIEVKARKNKANISELINFKQKRRITNAMQIFMSSKKYHNQSLSIRFDLIIIRIFRLPIHIKNFWC